ncbi:hypothetical protein SDRG_06554 [Saprolegnia diclina VS20]|uniref:Kazal-like domain-containing protein n=1 Tax=Saprolegnia diclina (strain VS20) TaxID=1156394 RepID=T0QPL8_SAPDV|nr:hypothetical protein SDRG_06554 [Saprolegnia diclina VS20]EQC35795.1 hypothetical protein SDRG_06554 [Saprolegnia diclina VS20]|eukprot:XP_008610557.1 hypothetical protein SDRG_06554 [Saprolegnia diclina VS20]
MAALAHLTRQLTNMQAKLLLASLAFAAFAAAADKCPTVCIDLFDEVCGSDGKTYGNECKLDIAACADPTIKLVSKGACGGSPTQAGCPIRGCIEILSPVCGSDGVNYDNECFLRMAKCKKPELTLVSNTSCDGSTLNSTKTTAPTTVVATPVATTATPSTAAPKAPSAAVSTNVQCGVLALVGLAVYATA